MPRVRVISRNFMEMVAGLPPAKLDLLYKRHWTCQAVLRSLPPLAKLYVMRLLYVEEAVPSKSLQDWALPDAQQKHQVAINRMEKLRVILVERKKEVCYRMNPVMQKQLLQALSISKGPPRDVMPGNVAVRLPTPAELDTYAMKQWESVLLQLVSSASSEAPIVSPNFFVIDMFKLAGLLLSSKPNSAPSITDTGFQFLLMDTNSQLWQLVQVYVSAAEDRGTDSGELIGFLLELGFHTVGEAYSVGALTTPLQKVLEELAALGLVQLQKGMKEQWYIPTKLASNLSASLSESSDMQSSEVLGTQGCIVVETNFRVYAYTASKLQTEILRRFARLEYQLPNLVVGALTKESINTAFSSGISAEQIITYLSKHAHPHVAKRMPVVPETVSDQIRLWESDRNRVELLSAYFYDDFPSTEVYETVLNHARSIGGLLWEDASNRRLVVREELHGDMRLFIRRQSGAAGQRG
ncbi:hypothetical protein BDL97_11G032600 [Sphagnum fallax]|nr:hypothetical protein BDL97_11G032600 [Sphagnum fallax]